jgi:hypothetical protein
MFLAVETVDLSTIVVRHFFSLPGGLNARASFTSPVSMLIRRLIGMMGWAKQNPTLAAGIAALLVGGLALAGTGGGGKRESSLGMLLALLLGGGTFLGAQKLLSVDDAGKAAGDH